MAESSTIRLSKKCKQELRKFGSYGDTHETIIWRLITRYKNGRRRRNGKAK